MVRSNALPALMCFLAAITFSSCKPKSGPAHSDVAATTQNQVSDTATKDESTSSADAPSPPPDSDPLSAEALAAQQKLLASNRAAADQADRENKTRDQLINLALSGFRQAVEEMKAQGVKFETLEPSINEINMSRKSQGVYETVTVYKNADDTFRLTSEAWGGAAALVKISGTTHSQIYKPIIRTIPVLDGRGKVVDGCKVALTYDGFTGREDTLSCMAIINGNSKDELVTIAKKYLISEMQHK